MSTYLIYKYTSNATNKSYIGFTKNLIHRHQRHQLDSRNGSSTHFHRAIRLHGIDDFRLEIIETHILSKKEASLREIYFVAKYNTKKTGYNMTEGGDSGPCLSGELNGMFGKTHSQTAKNEMSRRKKLLVGNRHPHYGKISPLKGKSYSEIMGEERAILLKQRRSNSLKGIAKPNQRGERNPAKRINVRRKISIARRIPVVINNVVYECKKDACQKLKLSLYKVNKLL